MASGDLLAPLGDKLHPGQAVRVTRTVLFGRSTLEPCLICGEADPMIFYTYANRRSSPSSRRLRCTLASGARRRMIPNRRLRSGPSHGLGESAWWVARARPDHGARRCAAPRSVAPRPAAGADGGSRPQPESASAAPCSRRGADGKDPGTNGVIHIECRKNRSAPSEYLLSFGGHSSEALLPRRGSGVGAVEAHRRSWAESSRRYVADMQTDLPHVPHQSPGSLCSQHVTSGVAASSHSRPRSGASDVLDAMKMKRHSMGHGRGGRAARVGSAGRAAPGHRGEVGG